MRVSSLPAYLYKSTMPNLCQVDKRSDFLSKSPNPYCGPVAISNALIYLARNGFPMIISPMGKLSTLQAQFKLIELLAKYMNTTKPRGTDPLDLISGLEKYIRERGYRTSISSRGFLEDVKGDRDKYYDSSNIPTPRWIMKGAIEDSNVVLNIGYYKRKGKGNDYKRSNGHYVTVAGFKSTKDELIIHDPGPGRALANSKLVKISQGTLLEESEEERPASGYYACRDINENEEIGKYLDVIDGGIVFRVCIK